MPDELPVLKIKLQIYCGDEIAMGPGKADLLDAIVREGSISGAGRALGMSYRRAWLLVDAMNRCWREPLVQTATGGQSVGGRSVGGHSGAGQSTGGARLTPHGENMLRCYRGLQEAAAGLQDSADWATMRSAILPAPKAHQK